MCYQSSEQKPSAMRRISANFGKMWQKRLQNVSHKSCLASQHRDRSQRALFYQG
jgi:hypothetical protein